MTKAFVIRKIVYDYLQSNLSDIADVSVEHPTTNNSTGKAIIAVSYVRDSASGRYVSQDITNPEVMISCYHSKELYLTKPLTGVFDRIIEIMKLLQPGCNFHKVSDRYVGFIDQTLLYTGFMVYRFYTSD